MGWNGARLIVLWVSICYYWTLLCHAVLIRHVKEWGQISFVVTDETRYVTKSCSSSGQYLRTKKKLTNAGTCGTTCQFYGSPFASFIIYCLLLDVLICSKLCWHSVMSVLRMYFQHFHWLTTLKSCDYKQFQNIPYDVYKMCYVGCRYIWNISNIYCNIDKISKINKIYIYLFLFIYFVKTQQKHNYN